jgi:hypothetical protein
MFQDNPLTLVPTVVAMPCVMLRLYHRSRHVDRRQIKTHLF